MQLLWTPGFLTIATIRKVFSLRKQPTFFVATTGFRARWRLRISVPLTHHYPDLTSASDWVNQNFPAARPIRSTSLKFLHIVRQTSQGSGGGFSKCRMFSQAKVYPATWREQWETNSPPSESNLPWRNWYTLCCYLLFRTTVIAGDKRSPQS